MGGKGRGGSRRTLDPHNVGDRLTPLMCIEEYNAMLCIFNVLSFLHVTGVSFLFYLC